MAKPDRRGAGCRRSGGAALKLKEHYALENADMMRAKFASDRVALQALGQAVRKLGFGIQRTEHGIDIAGIGRDRVLYFSDGLKSIEGAMAEKGIDLATSTRKQASAANYEQRRGKYGFEAAIFIPWWRRHNELAGFAQLSVEDLKSAAPALAATNMFSAQELVARSVKELLADGAVIDSEHDILVGAIEGSDFQVGVDEITVEVQQLLASGQLVELEGGRLVTEQTARHLGALPVPTVEPLSSYSAIRSVLSEASSTPTSPARMNGAQRQAVFAIAGTDRQVTLVDSTSLRGPALRLVADTVAKVSPPGHSVVHVHAGGSSDGLAGLDLRPAESALHDSRIWASQDVTVFVHGPHHLDSRDAAQLESLIQGSGVHAVLVAPATWLESHGQAHGFPVANAELYSAALEGPEPAQEALQAALATKGARDDLFASQDALHLVATAGHRDSLNAQLRLAAAGSPSTPVSAWEPRDAAPELRHMAQGDLLHVRRRFDGVGVGEWLTVALVDLSAGRVSALRKQGEPVTIEMQTHRHRLTHGRSKSLALAVGELTRVTATMPSVGIRKGERARVVELGAGRVVLETLDASRRRAELSIDSGALPIDYGYAWSPEAPPVGPSARSETVVLYADLNGKLPEAMALVAAEHGVTVRDVASRAYALERQERKATPRREPPLLGLARDVGSKAMYALRDLAQVFPMVRQLAALGGQYALEGDLAFKAQMVVAAREAEANVQFVDPVSKRLARKLDGRIAALVQSADVDQAPQRSRELAR